MYSKFLFLIATYLHQIHGTACVFDVIGPLVFGCLPNNSKFTLFFDRALKTSN